MVSKLSKHQRKILLAMRAAEIPHVGKYGETIKPRYFVNGDLLYLIYQKSTWAPPAARAGLSRTLKRLKQRGLLTVKTTGRGWKRGEYFYLTDAGRRALTPATAVTAALANVRY